MSTGAALQEQYQQALSDLIARQKARVDPRREWYRRYEKVLLGALAVLAFLAIWELLAVYGLSDPLYFSSPSRIYRTAIALASDGTLLRHMRVSGAEYAIGLGLAIITGIPIGIGMGWYRRMDALLAPFTWALFATPRIALLPLIIIWVGIGIWSKVLLIFLSAIFPIIVNAEAGVRAVERTLLKAARSFGASDWDTFRTVVVPNSVPFLITGVKLAAGRALVGVVVGELYAATEGIGYMISVSGSTFQTDKVFVGVSILAAAGILIMVLLERVEKRFEVWRPERS